MRVFLFEAFPIDTTSGLTVPVRMVNADCPSLTTTDSKLWVPAITSVPTRSITMSQNGEPAPVDIRYSSIGFSVTNNLNWSQLWWEGANAAIWVGENTESNLANFTKIFTGKLGPITRDGKLAEVALLGQEALLDKPLLTSTYAGTGAAEGPIELTGTLKPFAYGTCLNVEPILVNAVKWIYQVHGYGAITAIDAVYENALTLGAPTSTVSTYAALDALSLAEGQWAAAPAIGMFRLGAQPSGKISADVRGPSEAGSFANTVGQIASNAIKLAFPSATIDATTFGAFTQPWNFYTTDQITVGEVVRSAFYQAGGYSFTNEAGVFKAGTYFSTKTPVVLTTETLRSEPFVISVKQLAAASPVYRVKVGYDRCWSQHSISEISPAIAEIGIDLANLETAADNALNAANAAQADADVSLARLESQASDNILDRTDKFDLVTEYSGILAEQSGITSQATGLSITTELTAYTAAVSALTSYLTGLSPAYNDTTQDTTIVAATHRAKFVDLYTARQAVLNKISEIASQRSTWDGVTGANRPADNATVNRVHSGTSFPFTPVNGDTWHDTSVTPQVTKLRVGGVWVSGPTTVTNTNQITDGANLGQTAVYTSVVGAPTNLAGLDTTAANLLNFASGAFISKIAASNVSETFGGGIKTGATGNNTSFRSAKMTDGVVFQGRFINNSGKTQGVFLTTATQAVGNFVTGEYGFFLDGSNLRTVKNGSSTVISVIQSTEQLTLTYDNKTGVINYYRGNLLIDTATVATGIQYYLDWRPNTVGSELTNATIFPYSTDSLKLTTVEPNANRTLGEGTLNRNSFFEEVDSTGNLAAWRYATGTGTTNTRVIDTDARKGQYVINVAGSGILYLVGESFPVRPSQTLWFHPRVKLLLGNDGTTSGTLRVYAAVEYSEDANFSTSGFVIHSQLGDGNYVAGTTYEAINRITIPATYSTSKLPKYARVYLRLITAAPNLGQARIDFLDVRDTQIAATLGAQAGTNVFRTDGSTVMTQAEIRTAEGTAQFLSGQSVWATYATTLPSKLEGIAAGATVNGTYRQATAPTSPINGDFWFDTSTTPNVTKVRIGGAWVNTANLVTSTSHISDDAGLATTALWSGVSGEGRPENNADITSINSGQTALTVNADHTGTVLSGQLPKTVGYTRISGSTNVTSSSTWSRTLVSGDLTSSIGASTGVLTITAMASTSAVVDIISVYNSVTRTIRLTVTRSDAAAPVNTGGASGGGSTVSGPLSATVTSATESPFSPEITIEAGTSGSVSLSAVVEYSRDSSATGSTTAYGKWQWREIGGSWGDVGTEITGSSAWTINEGGEPEQQSGSINVNMTKSSLTAGVDYQFRCLMRRSGSVNVFATGSYSLTST